MSDEQSDEKGSDRIVEIDPVEPLSLDEALSIVGEETRARIIVALGSARSTDPTVTDALAFSELMERTGVEDSGRFNYHLDALVGPFVRRDDDGYALRLPGRLVYEAIVAGTLTERRTVDPFPVGPCPRCDHTLSAAYHPDHLLTVECPGCETLFDAAHFPAKGLEDRRGEALLDAAYQRRHHKLATMRRGVCHSCGAVVDCALADEAAVSYGDGPADDLAGLDAYAVLECTGCKTSLVGHPANVALTTPPVVGLFADHGRDAALARWWREPVVTARRETTVYSSVPPSVTIPFEIDDDRLTVTLDDALDVVRTERTTATDGTDPDS